MISERIRMIQIYVKNVKKKRVYINIVASEKFWSGLGLIRDFEQTR